jgi:3-oxoacyl-[acyl-carrier protein] reductase
MRLLEGKTGIVSGSTRGIGKGIARGMLNEGATVWITGRDPGRLEQVAGELGKEYPGRVRSFQGDLTLTPRVRSLGALDIAVANIGSGRSQAGWDVPDPLWEESLGQNFLPSVKLAREALRVMVPQGAGNIVFIASIAGVETIAAPVPYAAAKAALLAYMKNTASLVARHGVRMNAVSPGNIWFEGGTWDRKLREDRTAVERYVAEQVPLGRFGTPEEIARAVCFLASDAAAFITGANLVIDGGQTRGL